MEWSPSSVRGWWLGPRLLFNKGFSLRMYVDGAYHVMVVQIMEHEDEYEFGWQMVGDLQVVRMDAVASTMLYSVRSTGA